MTMQEIIMLTLKSQQHLIKAFIGPHGKAESCKYLQTFSAMF